ncbi:MAG: hypothetical protein KAH57_05065 [Thermoplasmata archaeon]|nr:hypothetical protein [Thermoplasmata archaeon]
MDGIRETRGDDDLEFDSLKLYKENGALYRGAFGDLIPDRSGDEMATCSRNGEVRAFWGSGNSWEHEVVHTSYWSGDSDETAEVFSITAGSVIGGREGDEMAICDEAYSAYLIWYEGGEWVEERIWKDDNYLYEIAIGDLNDDPGNEVVVVGYTGRVAIISGDRGSWDHEVIHTADLPLDACAISDVSSEHEGNEIIVGGLHSKVTMLYRDNGTWGARDIADMGDEKISDLVVADIDPRYEGVEVIASTHSGSVYLLHEVGGNWVKDLIHSEGTTVYGLEVGALVDGEMTLSIATYNRRVGIIWFSGSYQFKEVYREEWIMLGTGIHDIDPTHDGPEVFGFSERGQVTMIYSDEPGASIVLPFASTNIRTGDEVSIPVLIRYTGGFDGQTTLGSSEGTLTPTTITGNGFVELSFSTAGMVDGDSGIIVISANNVEGIRTAELAYVIDDGSPTIDISPGSLDLEIGADRQRSFDIAVNSSSPLLDPIEISPHLLPMGMGLSFNNTLCDPCGTPTGIRGTLSINSWAEPGVDHFFITAVSGTSTRRAIPLTVTIQEATLADVELILSDDVIFIQGGEVATVDIRAISINGYRSEVALTMTYPESELTVDLDDDTLLPTGNTTLRLTGSSQGGPFIVRVTASGPSLKREALLKVYVNPPPPDIVIGIPDLPLQVVDDGSGNSIITFTIRLEPLNSIVEDVRLTMRENGKNISLTSDPTTIDRLPYPLNMTVVITTPRGEMPEEIVLYLEYRGGGPKKIDLPIAPPETDPADDDGPNPWIGAAIIGVLLVSALLLLLLMTRTNLFNRDEDSSDHGEDRIRRGDVPPGERDHGRGGRLRGSGPFGP